MAKFFVAFFVFSVVGLSALSSVNAGCKPGRDCTDCWCHTEQGHGCCAGFDCNSNILRAGTCKRTVCKGAPHCDNCWCNASSPCCAGYYCSGNFGSGVCKKGRDPSNGNAYHGLHGG